MINILGYLPGKSDKWIILGSHFDTMPGIPNFKGANDSGSSTGVLIEMARLLNNYELNHGLIFAFLMVKKELQIMFLATAYMVVEDLQNKFIRAAIKINT